MDKVGVLVKFFLNVIRFLCKRGKRDGDFFPALVVEQNLFNTEKYEITSIYDRFYVVEER